VIEVENLVKIYRRRRGLLRTMEFRALDGVSFKIKRGEIAGIIGPNGSGKSTLLKILTGIVRPDRGNVRVLDLIPWERREELARHIGVVFGGKSGLLPYVPVYENLSFLCHLYGVKENRIEKLARDFHIENLLNAIPVQLSLGQRMRVELVAAILHNPEVLFLDEPTVGLDIVAKKVLLAYLRKIARKRIVVFVSHDLGEVEELCTRIIIMNAGRKVFDGSIADLKGIVNYKICRIVTERPVNGKYVHRIKVGRDVENVISQFLKYGIKDLEIFSPPIEEVVAKFYGEGHVKRD